MRNSFLIILIALIVVGGASYTFVRNKEQRNAELEKIVRKEEAKAKTAEAKRKTAEAEKAKAREDFKDVAYFEPFYLKEFVASKPKKLI